MTLPWQLLTTALPEAFGDGDARASGFPTQALDHESPASFEHIYETHFDFVWRNLRRLGVDDSCSDDAAHDVFLVVYRQLSHFDGRNLRGWLFAIAQRVAWHYRRAAARRRTSCISEADDCAANGTGPDASVEQQEELELVHSLVQQLSEERRAVFILSELEQMIVPDIARMLGIPLNTAYSRLRLARRDFGIKLRNRLAVPSVRSVP